jgi:hypothetical protein
MPQNYIDELALDIFRRSEGEGTPEPDDLVLYRMYGLLALSKGTATTAKDVHDAWSAWCAKDRPEHPSLVPFDQLAPHVQAMDAPYVWAIHDASRARE